MTLFFVGAAFGFVLTFLVVTHTEKQITERVKDEINDDPLRLVDEREADLIIAGLKPDLFKFRDRDSTWFHNAIVDIEQLDKSLGYQRFTPTAFEVRSWKGHFEHHWRNGYRAQERYPELRSCAKQIIAALEDPDMPWEYYEPSRFTRGVQLRRGDVRYIVANDRGVFESDHVAVLVFQADDLSDVTSNFSSRERFAIALAKNRLMQKFFKEQEPMRAKEREAKLEAMFEALRKQPN
jgi:hypothetical protein